MYVVTLKVYSFKANYTSCQILEPIVLKSVYV